MGMTTTEKIRIISKRNNLSLGDLAEATGQTRQNLSNKMSRDNFSEAEIKKIAEVLGCTVEIVFTLPDGEKI